MKDSCVLNDTDEWKPVSEWPLVFYLSYAHHIKDN